MLVKVQNVSVLKTIGMSVRYLSSIPVCCYLSDAWIPVGRAFMFKDGKFIKGNFTLYDNAFENKYPYAVIEDNTINSIMLVDADVQGMGVKRLKEYKQKSFIL